MNTKVSIIKNLAQARAKYAWECTRNANNDYCTMVSKLPAYIKTNGLLNTLAFLYSKVKYKKLLDDLREWLSNEEFGLIKKSEIENNEKFLEYLTYDSKTSANELVQYTTEILALVNWMRRFVEKTDEKEN